MLVPGPSPDQEIGEEVEIGAVEVVERGEDPGSPDRFALEEAPVVLTSMIEEDVDAFLAALDQEEIGAQRGELTDDGVFRSSSTRRTCSGLRRSSSSSRATSVSWTTSLSIPRTRDPTARWPWSRLSA
jgi:hypothetical protein